MEKMFTKKENNRGMKCLSKIKRRSLYHKKKSACVLNVFNKVLVHTMDTNLNHSLHSQARRHTQTRIENRPIIKEHK